MYCGTNDIALHDVNGQFISEFDHFLRTIKNNNQNGSMKNLVRLKKIINLSLNNDWITKNPFRSFKISFKKSDRVYLNADELERFEKVIVSSDRLKKVKDVFIFACYTGLAYVDIKSFCSQNIITGIDGKKWLIGKRGKSGIRYTLPLLPKAAEIYNKYKSAESRNSNDPILPVMSSQKTNDYLKEIAKLCGITKSISFHSGRHVFATTVTLVNGVPIETVSKMLGHTDISTTQIYARVIDQKIATDMHVLMDKLKNK